MTNAAVTSCPAGSATPARGQDAREYNYEHFRAAHVVEEVRRLLRSGIAPGEPAPDFDLPRAGGGSVRLSGLRGRPVLLLFASPT